MFLIDFLQIKQFFCSYIFGLRIISNIYRKVGLAHFLRTRMSIQIVKPIGAKLWQTLFSPQYLFDPEIFPLLW